MLRSEEKEKEKVTHPDPPMLPHSNPTQHRLNRHTHRRSNHHSHVRHIQRARRIIALYHLRIRARTIPTAAPRKSHNPARKPQPDNSDQPKCIQHEAQEPWLGDMRPVAVHVVGQNPDAAHDAGLEQDAGALVQEGQDGDDFRVGDVGVIAVGAGIAGI